MNESSAVHGIIVQMPLDSEHAIDAHRVTDAVSPDKDVDGFANLNFALLILTHNKTLGELTWTATSDTKTQSPKI